MVFRRSAWSPRSLGSGHSGSVTTFVVVAALLGQSLGTWVIAAGLLGITALVGDRKRDSPAIIAGEGSRPDDRSRIGTHVPGPSADGGRASGSRDRARRRDLQHSHNREPRA
jgi:hypothetical protein